MVRLNDFTMRDTRVLRTEGGGLVGIIWVLFRGDLGGYWSRSEPDPRMCTNTNL